MVIVGQRRYTNWFQWNRQDNWTGYSEAERIFGLVIMDQRG